MKLHDSTESILKERDITKQYSEIGEFFRRDSGRKIPADLAARAEEAMKVRMLKKRDPGIELRMQGAKLYSQLKGDSTIAVDDPANRETLDAILRLHKRAASTKVEFPKVAPGRASSIFSGTVVPPFDFASTPSPAGFGFMMPLEGNPAISATANVNGQISASVATTDDTGSAPYSDGSQAAIVGINLPPLGPGTLTISTSPVFSFVWQSTALNSIVGVSGSIGLQIYGMDAEGVTGAQDFQTIFSSSAQLDQSDGGNDIRESLSASLSVNPSMQYSCYVYLDVAALGVGQLNGFSLAMAAMSATVPSISYNLVGEFLL